MKAIRWDDVRISPLGRGSGAIHLLLGLYHEDGVSYNTTTIKPYRHIFSITFEWFGSEKKLTTYEYLSRVVVKTLCRIHNNKSFSTPCVKLRTTKKLFIMIGDNPKLTFIQGAPAELLPVPLILEHKKNKQNKQESNETDRNEPTVGRYDGCGCVHVYPAINQPCSRSIVDWHVRLPWFSSTTAIHVTVP